MKAQVYAMHIAYNGFEDKIWRTVEVSSKYTIAQLGYLILHTFDTLAYHAFEFSFKDTPYVLPMILDECDIENAVDAAQAKLQDLNLSVGDTMKMVYDYGCEQEFVITLKEILDMEKGTSLKYPRIVAGQGKGILDNMFSEEFGEVIKQIDEKNKSEQMYLSPTGEYELWDYRDFDIDEMNSTLKTDIESVQTGFEG